MWHRRRARWRQFHAEDPGADQAGSPPWADRSAWTNASSWTNAPTWTHRIPGKRRFLFLRFALFFGTLVMLLAGILTGLIALALRAAGVAAPAPGLTALLGCGVLLVFGLAAVTAGGLAFRRIGSPVAEVMAAADAVADGNLDARVRETLPGEFGRLARSFNHMTAELARGEQQRRSLTADVAHELRTPLHIIQGNLEGVLDGVYQPTREHIAATLEETRLLARLVSDLQTLSLAESGQLPLHKIRLDVAGVLADVITSFSPQAAAAGVTLSLDAPPAPLELEADPDRLDQVLSNLVANALRHTPRGGTITLRARPLAGGARIEVADTGAGIPAADLPYIFDRFWRGDRARTRDEGGSAGLGLAIARQLVQAHGGAIRAESQPGEGSTFIIEIPAGA